MDTYEVKVERDGRLVVEYGLVVKCMYSGWVCHRRQMTKDQVATTVTELVQLARTQLGCAVKRLNADGGTEFINATLKSFCAKHGLELHWTPARTQQLNGAAENTVRTFKDRERTMIAHAGASLRFWYLAGAHAAFVWNRTYIAPDTGMTPYESMRGKKPSVEHIGVWGCNAYCHVARMHRGALTPKSQPCIYLGHDETQNVANVYLPSTKKVIASRDVRFLGADSFSLMHALRREGDGLAEVYDHGLASGPNAGDAPPVAAAQGGPDAPPADEEFVVDRIVGQRTKNGRVQYKIHWAGRGADDDTWEPEAEVCDLAAFDVWEELRGLPRAAVDADAPAVAAVPAGPPLAAAAAAPAVGPNGLESDIAGAVQPVGSNPVPATDGSSAGVVAPPRRSPRVHDSSLSLDAAANSHRVHMAVDAIQDALDAPHPGFADAELVCAVTAGLSLLEDQTPLTYAAAMASPDKGRWQAAMDAEMAACERMQVWDLVPRDSVPRGAGQTILPPKWVFKVKTDENGVVTTFKARITPKGFLQREGVNFSETFAPTGMYKTMRVGLSLSSALDHELDQLDVPTAFLNADVEEEVYMELPEGYRAGKEHLVCKLRKALYGLKQAPRNWYLLVSKYVVEHLGYKATASDPCLFHRRSQHGPSDASLPVRR